MRTIEVKLYQCHELPTDRAKDRAREWLRLAMMEDDLAEFTRDDFRDTLKALGFHVELSRGSRTAPAIYYTLNPMEAGFIASWSASAMLSATVAAFIADRPATSTDSEGKTHQHPENAKIASIAQKLAQIAHEYPDSHAACTAGRDGTTQRAEWDPGDPDVDYDDDDSASAAKAADTARAFEDLCQKLAAWFAAAVDREYAYQLSDEAIDEMMQANGYEFTEDGERA